MRAHAAEAVLSHGNYAISGVDMSVLEVGAEVSVAKKDLNKFPLSFHGMSDDSPFGGLVTEVKGDRVSFQVDWIVTEIGDVEEISPNESWVAEVGSQFVNVEAKPKAAVTGPMDIPRDATEFLAQLNGILSGI